MRKPCFNCGSEAQYDMRYGECFESPLCTPINSVRCEQIDAGGHWEDCLYGAKSEEYPAFLAKQNQVQCPCCKGSGFVAKAGFIVDEIRALEWRGPNAISSCALCGGFKMHGHYAGCPLAAILRRLK